MARSLELQVQELREENALLKSLLQKNALEDPKLEVARWELVKSHMLTIAKRLILGLDPTKNRPFPREEHMKEAILEAFNTPLADIMTRKVFDRVWVESLRKKVKKTITNRRGRLTTITQNELWLQLGVPKPHQGTQEEIAAWKRTLQPFQQDDRRRWSEDDPFGSNAFYNTVIFVKFGINHSVDEPLRLTAKQLAWFAYVMYLVVDGDQNMKENEMRLYKKAIKGMKEYVLQSRQFLTRIELIVSEDANGLQEVLREDLENE